MEVTTASHQEGKGKVVAIVGAGLVGALEACYLAKRGYQVFVTEILQNLRWKYCYIIATIKTKNVIIQFCQKF